MYLQPKIPSEMKEDILVAFTMCLEINTDNFKLMSKINHYEEDYYYGYQVRSSLGLLLVTCNLVQPGTWAGG